jgi:methyl-accepting chemotaxis protein
MRIGTQISLGFGIILVLAAALGTLAVINMTSAAKDADIITVKKLPAAVRATEVERQSLLTMYNMRAYGLTFDERYLKPGEEHLAKVDEAIKAAHELAKAQGLKVLEQASLDAGTQAKAYRELVEKTKAIDTKIGAITTAMNASAGEYMKECHAYLESQVKKIEEEIESGAEAAKIAERFRKTALANDLIDLGNDIRIANWRSRAMRDPEMARSAMPNFQKITALVEESLKITRQQANIDQLKAVLKAGMSYKAEMEAYLQLSAESDRIAAERGKTADLVLAEAQAAAKKNLEDSTTATEETSVALSRASTILIVGLIAVAVIGIGAAFLITRGIIKALVRIVEDLSSCSEQTASASEQVASGAQALANGTSENAAAIEETSASLEEMNSLVRQSSQNSDAVNGLAGQAKGAGERGAQAMTELGKAIAEIKANADQTAKIVKTIDEIAFQTNLLALNAAVEAARAGDAGKGFAVVAEEVRNLAQRAGEAARNTAQLIEQSVKAADNGVNLSKNVTAVVSEMTGASQKVNDLAGEVAASSREISQGIDQISKAVRQMDQVTQSNAAGAEENSAVGEEMSAQAQQLAQLVVELEAMVRATQSRGMSAPRPTMTAKTAAHAPVRQTASHAPAVRATATHATGNQAPAKRQSQNIAAPVDGSKEAKQAIPFDDDGANQQTLNKF